MDALIKAILREAENHWLNSHLEHPKILLRFDYAIHELLRFRYSEENGRAYLHGLKGVKFLFGVSYQDAVRIKREIIKDAVVQEGRGKPFKFDIKLAAELYEKSKQSNNQ